MGHGVYSSTARSARSETLGYKTKPIYEIFSQKSINNAMSPFGIKFRESRDSKEHPKTLPIIIALDETGSMGSVPHFLVKNGFPEIMDKIIKQGIDDPQVLFLGIGDHEYDLSPLQVGQFESSDALLDKWLTDVWLEGKGGGNNGESYHLAWYFAACHTILDCFEKCGQKGILFTIGDEPVLEKLPESYIKAIMGPGQYQDFTAAELFNKARETYHVFHIHITSTFSGSRQSVVNKWKQLLHDNLLIADRQEDVVTLIADTVLKIGLKRDVESPVTPNIPVVNSVPDQEEPIL